MSGVFLNHSPLYFMKQSPSLYLEPQGRLAASEPQEFSCVWPYSTGVTSVCLMGAEAQTHILLIAPQEFF